MIVADPFPHWEHLTLSADDEAAARNDWERVGRYDWHWLQTVKQERAELAARWGQPAPTTPSGDPWVDANSIWRNTQWLA